MADRLRSALLVTQRNPCRLFYHERPIRAVHRAISPPCWCSVDGRHFLSFARFAPAVSIAREATSPSREAKCPDDGDDSQQAQDDPRGRLALPGVRVEGDVMTTDRTLFGLLIHLGAALWAWQGVDGVAVEVVVPVRVFVFVKFVVRPFDRIQEKSSGVRVRKREISAGRAPLFPQCSPLCTERPGLRNKSDCRLHALSVSGGRPIPGQGGLL